MADTEENKGNQTESGYLKRLWRDFRHQITTVKFFLELAAIIVGAWYATVAMQQKDQMIQQTGQMVQQTKLQIGTAHLVYGVPLVTPTPWMGVYDNNGQVSAVVNMYSQGRVYANSIEAAIKVDFLESEPTDYNFSDQDFQPVSPSTLPKLDPETIPYDPNVSHPAKKVSEHATVTVFYPDPIPPAEGFKYARKRIYVWGVIRYKDFTDGWADPNKFCRFTPTESFFENRNKTVPLDCNTKKPKH